MISLASTLPNSNTGYVAAAYIVFLAIVLIYVAIMAVRLGRVERKVKDLHDANRGDPARTGGAVSGVEHNSPEFARPDQERETV
ncbi:MAG: hypothetical protein WB998_13510 [Solirubrobacteraceae bacterium]